MSSVQKRRSDCWLGPGSGRAKSSGRVFSDFNFSHKVFRGALAGIGDKRGGGGPFSFRLRTGRQTTTENHQRLVGERVSGKLVSSVRKEEEKEEGIGRN